MCQKPAQSKTDERARRRRDARRQPDPVRPWQNTRPRGNAERDDHDIERGLERLSALVGR
jgi:hypothetical protein